LPKSTAKKDELLGVTRELLVDIQANLYQEAQKFLQENTHDTDSYDEFKKIMETKRGFIRAPWCENAECEAKIQDETKATTRCLPLDAPEIKSECIKCGKPAKYAWLFALSY